jgi:pimeloyl-ACP methyl ester carboxylesterase
MADKNPMSTHQMQGNTSSKARLIRGLIRALSLISHRLSAQLALKLWFSSPKYQQPKREMQWLQSARFSTLEHSDGPIAINEWGEHSVRTILLVHGWSGRGPQLGAFASNMLKQGYRVVAFDGPGHGRSPGNSSTIFKMESVLHAVAEKFGPIDTFVAHSFGVLVTALAVKNGLLANKLVFISSPTSAEFLFSQFCNTLSIHRKTQGILQEIFARRFGPDLWQKLSASHNLLNSKLPTLIVHDKSDSIIPYSWSEKLSSVMPNSQLLLTEGLGHRRILRDQNTISQVSEFIQSAKYPSA